MVDFVLNIRSDGPLGPGCFWIELGFEILDYWVSPVSISESGSQKKNTQELKNPFQNIAHLLVL